MEITIGQLKQRVQTLVQQQDGKVLLERSKEPRYWDTSTGFVYAHGLDDVMVPILLAFCPWGCLAPGESAFSKSGTDGSRWKTFGRAFSLDLGVRSAIVDGEPDQRHNGQASFLGGVGFNPFRLVRLSGGLYTYNNALTEEWNVTWYAGVTFDILHTAEFFGALNLSAEQWKATRLNEGGQ